MSRFQLSITASQVSKETNEAREKIRDLKDKVESGKLPEEALSQYLDDLELEHIEAMINLMKNLGEERLKHEVAYGRSIQNIARRLRTAGFDVSAEKGYYLIIYWCDK